MTQQCGKKLHKPIPKLRLQLSKLLPNLLLLRFYTAFGKRNFNAKKNNFPFDISKINHTFVSNSKTF
jgi:hypothetical protein